MLVGSTSVCCSSLAACIAARMPLPVLCCDSYSTSLHTSCFRTHADIYNNPHALYLQGAYYGLAASLAISARQTDYKTSNPKNAASYISNLFSMIGERPRTAHLLFYQLRA